MYGQFAARCSPLAARAPARPNAARQLATRSPPHPLSLSPDSAAQIYKATMRLVAPLLLVHSLLRSAANPSSPACPRLDVTNATNPHQSWLPPSIAGCVCTSSVQHACVAPASPPPRGLRVSLASVLIREDASRPLPTAFALGISNHASYARQHGYANAIASAPLEWLDIAHTKLSYWTKAPLVYALLISGFDAVFLWDADSIVLQPGFKRSGIEM